MNRNDQQGQGELECSQSVSTTNFLRTILNPKPSTLNEKHGSFAKQAQDARDEWNECLWSNVPSMCFRV